MPGKKGAEGLGLWEWSLPDIGRAWEGDSMTSVYV